MSFAQIRRIEANFKNYKMLEMKKGSLKANNLDLDLDQDLWFMCI